MAKNRFLTSEWQNKHLKRISHEAGPRYTPHLNVDLPISDLFEGLSRNSDFYREIREKRGKLHREFNSLSIDKKNLKTNRIYTKIERLMNAVLASLSDIREYGTDEIPWESINKVCDKTINNLWELSSEIRNQEDELLATNGGDKGHRNGHSVTQNNEYYISEVVNKLRAFSAFSKSTQAKLSNSPFLMLVGVAGTGKTHLLCDLVETRMRSGSSESTLLVFGEKFETDAEPIEQIIKQLGLNLNKHNFLKLLNNAGRTSKSRAILAVDALNETRSGSYWKKNLRKLVVELKKYPHISLVISVRSGFENEVILKGVKKLFQKEEHRGFEFKEWEAVNIFFQEYDLPLPEIPLLMPEFQNPLFLMLFCKAFTDRSNKNKKKGNKEIFRGHEGATYIFESYVKKTTKKIAKKFNIPSGPRVNIWDSVIEKAASKMVDANDDRISENELLDIIGEAYPLIDSDKLALELERNLLLIKVPKYSIQKNEYDGFSFRFPFQKFSDHLIGRYLFRKYEQEFGRNNKNIQSAKIFFSKRRKFGKYLSNEWNLGIVEALSIQCPEQLKGVEFLEVAPYLCDTYIGDKAFIDSLAWRKHSAFSAERKNTLSHINRIASASEDEHHKVLNVFLAVAQIPNHPFNAAFLHEHLSKRSMAERDSWWSIFLHEEYGNHGSVDRIIEWGWSTHDKSHISDEGARLCCVALSWFLTTSNRFLRDRATKSLVALLTGRLSVLLDIMKLFREVNDPYVLERLYAVAYGCAIRSANDTDNLKSLAQWIYKECFLNGSPPEHILLRDYARGIIETALHNNVGIRISRSKLEPPYKSVWPKNIPTEKWLKESSGLNDDLGGRDLKTPWSIWSSVMYNFGNLADFGNYVLNSAVGNWSGRRIGTRRKNYDQILKSFLEKLTPHQNELFEKAVHPFYGINASDISIQFVSASKETVNARKKKERLEKQQKRKKIDTFLQSLSLSQRAFYKREIEPNLNERMQIEDPQEYFDVRLGQRWLFDRVIKLGWSYELHGNFDKNLNYYRGDRSEHKPERIGKKYQWIALHELLAKLADNFELKRNFNSIEDSVYSGSWQVGLRDIDPTCLLKNYDQGVPEIVELVNSKNIKDLYKLDQSSLPSVSWLKNTSDLPDPKNIIEIVDTIGDKWLVLEGSYDWEQDTPPEYEKYSLPHKRLWYLARSYLVAKQDKNKLYSWAKKQNFAGGWMPMSGQFYDVFLGEYPHSPSFLYQYTPYYGRKEWIHSGDRKKLPAKVLVTDDEYCSSGSSRDCSTEETISVKLPAKFIVEKMGLKQTYLDGRFFDSQGELVAFDPKVFDKDGYNQLLVKRNNFLAFLEQHDYSLIWTITGEKMALGETGRPNGWMEANGVYTLGAKNNVIGSIEAKYRKR